MTTHWNPSFVQKEKMKEETKNLKQRLALLELKKDHSVLYRYAYDALKFRIVSAK